MTMRRPNLIAERARRGWTQAEAARRFGVSKQTYCNWELAKSEPTGSKTLLMSKVYECDGNALLEVTDTEERVA